jgi:hypothetical protein
VFLAGYALVFIGAVKAFGLRRVLMFFVGILVIGITIAMGTLRGVTGRRY